MYAMDAGVALIIPWRQALPERVALASFLTELSEVKSSYLIELHSTHIHAAFHNT